nr:polyphosphate kinase 2 [Aureivirga marina]
MDDNKQSVSEETKQFKLTKEDFLKATSLEELDAVIKEKEIDISYVKKKYEYQQELQLLQIELVKLQQWISKNKKRVVVIFEGRDAAGKGGSIRRFSEHLNPRSMRLVALTKPTEEEQGQWYFRRYIKELPNPGEIVFFDRSWYNRAVVEPVMGFCTSEQYKKFMVQVPEFEHMLYEDGVTIVKFWFSISKEEQQARFLSRLKNPLKRWKFSPVDQRGQELWNDYTFYKNQMFSKTHTTYSPWIIVKTNDKQTARLESIRYVLSLFDYDGKRDANINISPDPNVVMRYFRSSQQLD